MSSGRRWRRLDSRDAAGGSAGEKRKCGETLHCLGGEDCAGEHEEELAVAGFERVGEDAAEKGEEEWKRPQPRCAYRLRGDE